MRCDMYVLAKANQLARFLKKEGSPTNTKDAAELWRVSSSSFCPRISGKNLIKLYYKAGYKPFSGFPLVKLTR